MAQSKLEAVDNPDKDDDQYGGDIVIADGPITTNLVNEASRPPIGTSNIAEIAAPIQPENFEPRENHMVGASSAVQARNDDDDVSDVSTPADDANDSYNSEATAVDDGSTKDRPQSKSKQERSPNPAILAAARKASELFEMAQQAEAETGQAKILVESVDAVQNDCATLIEKAGGKATIEEVADDDS